MPSDRFILTNDLNCAMCTYFTRTEHALVDRGVDGNAKKLVFLRTTNEPQLNFAQTFQQTQLSSFYRVNRFTKVNKQNTTRQLSVREQIREKERRVLNMLIDRERRAHSMSDVHLMC